MAQTMNEIINQLKDMEQEVLSIRENISDLIDIAKLPGNAKEVADILLSESQMIERHIGKYELLNNRVFQLFEKIEVRQKASPSTTETSTKQETTDKVTDSSSSSSMDVELRPQKDKGKRVQLNIPKVTDLIEPVMEQLTIMKRLYSLSNTDNRYIDYSGIYPRINFLQDSSPEEIRFWFDYGALNSIYTNPPEFAEISQLPKWIYQGVKDCYIHNPTMTPKDILVLKFLSAGPDFHKEERYPAYHFIQIAKADSFSITAQKLRKELPKFEEKDIHYRRAIGIRIVLQGLEASFKRGFRTYGGQKILSSIMISPAKTTPVSARNYMATKIKLLNTGAVRSSPQAQEKICQFRQHDLNTCPACTFDLKKQDKDKMPAGPSAYSDEE
ncbi:hypothetical protein ACOSQ2_019535 [Xanthoceras sorbifolium]